MMRLPVLVAAAVLALAAPAAAADWGPIESASPEASTFDSPVAAVDNQGTVAYAAATNPAIVAGIVGGTPEALADEGTQAGRRAMGATADGTFILVWRETPSTNLDGYGPAKIVAAIRTPADGHFRRQVIADAPDGVFELSLNVAPSGTALVSWSTLAHGVGFVTRGADGTFHPQVTIASKGIRARRQALAADGHGLLGYVLDSRLLLQPINPDGTLAPVVDMPTPKKATDRLDPVALDVAPSGGALLADATVPHVRRPVRHAFAAIGDVSAGFGGTRSLPAGATGRGFDVAVSDAGGIVAWREGQGRTAQIVAVPIAKSGHAGKRRVYKASGARYPDVAIDSAGAASIVWQQGFKYASNYRFVSARPGGRLGAPKRIVEHPGGEIIQVELATAADHTFILAWTGEQIFARSRASGEPFAQPTLLDEGNLDFAELASSPDGGVTVAIWGEYQEDPNERIVLRRFTP